MKAICINNKDFETRLVIGEEYEVLKVLDEQYKIQDNNGNIIGPFKWRFKLTPNSEDKGPKVPRGDDGMASIRPSYYNDKKITPLDYIKVNKLDFCEGNIIKYITRHRQKNGKQDLIKAMTYIEELIKEYDK